MGARGPVSKAQAVRQDNRSSRQPRKLAIVNAPVEIPAPPEGLHERTLPVWEAFWRSDVARAAQQPIYRAALTEWIRAVDERERVRPTFRRRRLVAGSQGQPVLNPLASYLRDLDHIIDQAERKFGMNPRDAAALGLTAAQAQITALDLNRMLERADRDVIDGNAKWAEEFTPG